MAHLNISETSKRRKTTGARTTILFISLCFSACYFQATKHDPLKAVLNADQFLKALYLDENPSEALKFCDAQSPIPGATDDLMKLISQIKTERGPLKTLTADSYLMMQGREMELFYIGRYENGVLYHRVAVVGDESAGYKVLGVWFQHEPYPENFFASNVSI